MQYIYIYNAYRIVFNFLYYYNCYTYTIIHFFRQIFRIDNFFFLIILQHKNIFLDIKENY